MRGETAGAAPATAGARQGRISRQTAGGSASSVRRAATASPWSARSSTPSPTMAWSGCTWT
eukprot:15448412-Alexandrium_andersonii.AAC.1